MASALTVLFLGCWLAGHSGVWGEPSYPKPNISLSPSGGVSLGGAVAIWCRGQRQGMRFMLNKEGRHLPAVASSGSGAVFFISNVSREDRGRYNCSYQNRSGSAAASSPSDPVELVVTGESGPLAPPCLTSHIIAGASAAAAGLLLLLVAFLCFRKTRARKGAAPRPSSTSPMGALKASAQQDPVYTSIDEGKEPQTLEPDPGVQGLTYAELDVQVLQAKRGKPAPAPESAQPSVYAAINRARGAPQ
ncbi:leukocyte immunoglobulin-like receptor subfamily A member 4 isoform X3 [Lepidochelys kempii]|uniref:leukocyte immunoglobulin-like receptor subfamily A member 4 isoform X3 n=1 Tax=Lepidochelys kempii TaxID=8472 RepID=UPI003C6F93BC